MIGLRKMLKKYFVISIFLFVLVCYYSIIIRRKNNLLDNNNKQANLSDNHQNKYIVYECSQYVSCGGWADRLKGIMSTYAISLLTDRKLVIRIKKTCDISKYLLPNEIDWNINLNQLENYHHLTVHNLFIYYNEEFIKNELKYINFLNYETNKDVIVIRTGFNLLPYLAANPEHRLKLSKLGFKNVKEFTIEKLFYKWYKKLFKFNRYLQTKYDKLLNNNLKMNKNSKLICGQIRLGGGGGVSIDLKFTSRQNTALYWSHIKNMFLKNNENSSSLFDYKLFITTDTPDVIDEATQVFGKDKVFGFKDSSYHIEFKRSSKQCNKLSELFIDFKLLGDCDMGVISHSGLFFVAHHFSLYFSIFIY
jgi:hypothetical protein